MLPDRPTARDHDVIGLLLLGLKNDEIARRLGMAERTVKSHLHELYLHFGITSGCKRTKLAMMFLKKA